MKAVISKNQFDRIKNFINETKEIPKSKLLKEVDKRGHADYPYVKGFEYISSIKGGKDFLIRKNANDWEQFKNAIISGRISDSELKKFKIGTKSFLDTPLGKDIGTALNLPPLREIKKEDVLGDKKKLTKDQNKKLNVDNDDDVDEKDLYYLRAMKKISEKKYTPAQIKAFDKDKDGTPFEPEDWKMMDEGSDCGCGDSDEHNDTRYMFFSNLEQMMRQARMLLQMDEDMLEDLLNNGHDWAADHIAEAKNNMDQVFDFIMGEMNGEGEDDSWDNEEEEEREMVYEGMRLKKKAFVSKELKNHLDKKIPLSESEFKYGSEKHIELLKEVKELYNKDIISLNETDEFIVNEFDPKPIKVKDVGEVYLGLIQEDYESDEELLSEAVYQGRKVQLGKRMAGDVKKFKVYVRNDKGNVVKVNFGQKGVKIKKNNPARRKSFRARHNCTNPGPRWKARYWSCRAW